MISTAIVINVFAIDLFLFIEKGILALSVLMCVYALEQLIKAFEGNKKSILWALLLMFIANGCYQGTVGIFVVIALVYILKYSKTIKEFIYNNIVTAICYGIPAILNYILVRFLFGNNRIDGETILTESINKIIDGTIYMLVGTYNYIPKYLFLILVIVLSIVIFYYSITRKQAVKDKVIPILSIIYIVLGTVFVTIAPQFMQATESIWFVARSTYSVAALLAILLLYLFMNFELKELTKKIITVAIIGYMLVQLNAFNKIAINHYTVNYIDNQIALSIVEQIQKYETESGNQITKMAIYKDKYSGYTYPSIFASGDNNIKAFSPDWSAYKVIGYHLGRNIELTDKNTQLEEEFKNQDWTSYNEEQLVFEGNILHMCVF